MNTATEGAGEGPGGERLPARTGPRRHQEAALTRLARRMARAGGWRHVLIVGLIALSVAAAVGVAISTRSSGLPVETEVAARFGAADIRVDRWGEGVSFAELPAELQQFVRAAGLPMEVSPEQVDVAAVLRRTLEPGAGILRFEEARAAGADTDVVYLALDPTEENAAGLLHVDGPAPRPGEVLAAPALLDAIGAEVGDEVSLPGGMDLEVVGTATDPRSLHQPLAVVAPGVSLPGGGTQTSWLVDLPGDSAAEAAVQRLRAAVDVGRSRRPAPVTIQSRDQLRQTLVRDRPVTETPAFFGIVVGAALLLQVAFVAAAAFATGTRRRLRDLGLLGATGASPEQIRGLVLREAAVLGTVGVVLGVAVGVVGAATLGTTILERFVGTPVPELRLHPLDLAGPAVLGLAAALAAAYLPARTAGRVPPATALAGRLPVGDVPRWITPAALAATAAGLAVLFAATRSAGHGPARNVLIGAGVAATTVGAAALAAPLLARLGRLADRLPARIRLAVRDTVRQRTRSAAAVAALVVVLIIPVVVSIAVTTEAARFPPRDDLRRDLVSVSGPVYAGRQLPPTESMVETTTEHLPPVEDRVDVTRLAHATRPGELHLAVGADHPPGPDAPGVVPPGTAGTVAGFGSATLATPELLEFLGLGHLTGTLGDDAAIVLDLAAVVRPEGAVSDGRARITVQPFGPAPAGEEPPVSTVVDLQVAEPSAQTWDLPQLLLAPTVAGRLDLEPAGSMTLLDLVRPLDGDTSRRLERIGSNSSVPFTVAGPPGDTGPDPTVAIASIVGLGLLLALIISAMTASLAATESDHDLELITAVGAPPLIRRRFHGWQAGYHTLLAALLAVPTGMLIYRAATIRRTADAWMTVPWGWLAVIVLALPAAVGLAHAVLMRSAPVRAPRRIA